MSQVMGDDRGDEPRGTHQHTERLLKNCNTGMINVYIRVGCRIHQLSTSHKYRLG